MNDAVVLTNDAVLLMKMLVFQASRGMRRNGGIVHRMWTTPSDLHLVLCLFNRRFTATANRRCVA